jgi:hypothetical protein
MAVYGPLVNILEDLFHVLLRYRRCVPDDHPLLIVLVGKLSDACSDLYEADVQRVKKWLRDKGMTAAEVATKWDTERAWWRHNKCIRKVIPSPAGDCFAAASCTQGPCARGCKCSHMCRHTILSHSAQAAAGAGAFWGLGGVSRRFAAAAHGCAACHAPQGAGVGGRGQAHW